MIQPAKWWIGLPVLAVLLAIAATTTGDRIEKNIGDRARAALSQAPGDVEDAQIAVEGRDVTVSGVAPSREAASQALAGIGALDGLRALRDATTQPPLAKPFVFTLERSGKRLALTGHAPAAGEREAIRAAAAEGGLEFSDTTTAALGAPKNAAALARFAATLLEALGDGKATIVDGAVSLTGAATSFDAYDRVETALKAPPAGVALGKVEITPPRVAPFVWSAAKSGETISLFGFAPSGEARAALAEAAAALPGAAATSDRTRVAGGAPSGDFVAAAKAALAALGKLSAGKVAFADAVLSIEGESASGATPIATSLREALPAGYRLGTATVAAGAVSPFVFTARKQGETLTLSGHAPDEAARAALVAEAKSAGDVLSDELSVAEGAPEGFAEAARAALHALARLDAGVAALAGRELAVEGFAYHAKARAEILARLEKELPPGYEKAARLGVEPTTADISWAELPAALTRAVARGVAFTPDNSAIAEESLPVVDALAFLLLRSPSAGLDIVGYHNGAGSESQDEAIGKRRAEIVRDHLIAAGVEASRLSAAGAATADGRRIEFSLR